MGDKQKILFYSDSSVNAHAAFSLLSLNMDVIEKNNIFIPNIYSNIFQTKNHQNPITTSFFYFKKELTVKPYYSSWYNSLRNAIMDGKNILLYGTFSKDCSNFLTYITKDEIFKDCSFVFSHVMGRIGCEAEVLAYSFFRKNINNLDQVASGIINRFKNNLFFINNISDKFNTKYFVDQSNVSFLTGLTEQQKQALLYLQLPVESMKPHMPAIELCCRSLAAREIYTLSKVDDNYWPRVQEDKIISCLCALEKEEGWSESSLIPPDTKEKILEQEKELLSSIDDVPGVKKEDLASPEQWYTDPWQPFSGVTQEQLKSFAAHLSRSISYGIQRRFFLAQDCLTKKQKTLNDFFHIYSPRYENQKNQNSQGEPLLSVLTMTYNHEKYIGRCIESVLMQKTKFPIQHIIVDDASNDATPEIIEKYSYKNHSIVPILLNNKSYAGSNVRSLFSHCRTEYVSLCDGDDFFTHPEKLERQVEFLQTHPECALCFHPVEVRFENRSPSYVFPSETRLPGGLKSHYSLNDLLQGNFIQTNSVVYRWRFRDGLPEWFDPTLCPGDWVWHLLHAEMGLIGFLPEVMSVYRRHETAVYINSSIGDLLLHRALFGMSELNTYDKANWYFKNKYFDDFGKLACGPFLNFFCLYTDYNDSSLFEIAIKRFPAFAAFFYKSCAKLAPNAYKYIEKFIELIKQ